jgi:hypothetical protein
VFDREVTLHLSQMVCEALFPGSPDQQRSERDRHQLLLEDLDPARDTAVDTRWLTGTVVTLARRMYYSRDFSPMPILADALQDAGCEDEAVLTHCRGDSVHVRGCWVVDLILGKS